MASMARVSAVHSVIASCAPLISSVAAASSSNLKMLSASSQYAVPLRACACKKISVSRRPAGFLRVRAKNEGGSGELWENTWWWAVDAPVEAAWACSGKDFMKADLWMTSIILPGTPVLVGGKTNEPGTCERRVDCYRDAVLASEDENSVAQELVFYGIQLLLSLDDSTHSFSYKAAGGNLPGFDVGGLVDYHSYFQLKEHPHSKDKSVVQWRYTSQPSPYLTKTEADHVCFSLYETAVGDLRTRLAAPPKTGIAHRRSPPAEHRGHLKAAFH